MFLHESGKPVCVQPIKFLRRIAKWEGRKPFRMISVSADSAKQTTRNFIAKQKIDWPVYMDPNLRQMGPLFGIESYPAFVILDHTGKMIFTVDGWSSHYQDSLRIKLKEAMAKAK